MAGVTLGVMTGASLAVAVIGQALAQARGLVTRHAIEQVDRLLSNNGIDVWDSFAHWVPHMIGARKQIVVAIDWTEFDRDGQPALALNMASRHGRATPMLRLTAWKEELTERRNDFEDTCLARLKALVPAGCQVTILADRGFGDHTLLNDLGDLGFAYAIRFRGNIHVTDAAGETRPATDWVGKAGRARKLRGARLLLVNAFAIALPTLLGAAGEALGMDRLLKSNTSKTRTHSLFRQGCMLYDLIPTMPEGRLVPFMARFAESVAQCGSFSALFAVV